MKRLINITYRVLIVITAVGLLFTSCEYQEFADAEYPEQLIYMPAAFYNNYMIDKVSGTKGESPTPGYTERYKVYPESNKFSVLLGVYRSGINTNGSFIVNIEANTDTISQMLAVGALPDGTLLLPSENYSLVPSIEMKDGERLGKFDLEVDLDFLQNNSPDNKFAIGVSISSPGREVNQKLATTIIVIDTKILE
ncbi:MAG: DUF1735 domain-containing protein [Draconibacterium sp.]|nr:DUF1735 domain-containing protein [Draconibacterium sp.]